MSHAEYTSKQPPVLSRLAMFLRQIPAVQTALARLRALFGGGTNPEPVIVDAFVTGPAARVDDAIEAVDEAPVAATPTTVLPLEAPPEPVIVDALPPESPVAAHDTAESDDIAPAVAQSATLLPSEPVIVNALPADGPDVAGDVVETDNVAAVAAPTIALLSIKAASEPVTVAFLIDAPVAAADTVETGDVVAAVAQPTDESEREALIRRRWRETGIRMWNPAVHGADRSTLCIQGRVALLPPKAGETMPGYDRLEFKLIEGNIVCEGFVLEPPERPRHRPFASTGLVPPAAV